MEPKNTEAAKKIKNGLRKIHSRRIMRDPFSIPAMIAVMDAAAKLFPNAGKNEDELRRGGARRGSCDGAFLTPEER